MENKFLMILTLVLLLALIFIAIFNITVVNKISFEKERDSQINSYENSNLISEVYSNNLLDNKEIEDEE